MAYNQTDLRYAQQELAETRGVVFEVSTPMMMSRHHLRIGQCGVRVQLLTKLLRDGELTPRLLKKLNRLMHVGGGKVCITTTRNDVAL